MVIDLISNYERDGLMGQDFDEIELNQTNSVIHSFASKIYLEALEPENDSVGRYDIAIQATDLSGAQVNQTLSLVIANRNDAPIIDENGAKESQLLVEWLSKQRLEGEHSTKTFRLFTDPDLRFDDNLTYQLIPGHEDQETDNWQLPNSIKIQQAEDGSVKLDLISPRGITAVIEQQQLREHLANLSTASDCSIAFTPLAEPTQIRGNQEQPLATSEIGKESEECNN